MVAHSETWLLSDHPVCDAKVGFAKIFLMPQPPLLTRPHKEGTTLAQKTFSKKQAMTPLYPVSLCFHR